MTLLRHEEGVDRLVTRQIFLGHVTAKLYSGEYK